MVSRDEDVVEMLGEVTAPSGSLVLIDAGLLGLWSHDGPPLVPEGMLPPETETAANSAVDLRIEGPDAAAQLRGLAGSDSPPP